MSTFRLANPTMILLSAAAMALLTVFAPGPFSLGGTALAQELPTDDPPVNFRVTGYGHDWIYVAWEVPRDRGITNYVLQRYESDDSSSPDVLSEGPTNGGAGHGWGIGTVKPDTQYNYVLMLKNDSGTTIIEASVSVRTLPAPTDTPPSDLSTDATLSALTLSGIDIGTFNSAITSYRAQVANNRTGTTVTATVNDDGANYKVKLDGVEDGDGVLSLAIGSNRITIEVTAEDGVTTRIYTVRVTRGESVNFRVTGYGHDWVAVAWEVPRNRGITNYVLQRYESDDSSSPDVLSEGPTNGGASHGWSIGTVKPNTQYNYVLMLKSDSGTTIIEASVSVRTLPAPTDTPPPALSTDATLSALTLSGIDIGTFNSAITSYRAQVANNRTETTVTATVNDDGANYKVKLDGVEDADGVLSLAIGSNRITIEVTAEDGSTSQIYTVIVTRDAPSPTLSTDATLSTLTLSGIDIGTFNSAITSYRAQVANNRTETTVTATVNDDGANYKVKLNGMEDGDGVLPLAVGSNVIAIEVTAEDGSTSQTYTVIVIRDAPSPSATGELPTDDPPVNFRVTGYGHDWIYVAWEVPRDRGITNYVLQRYESDDSSSPDVLSEGPTNGGAGHSWGIGTVKPDTQYNYVLMLKSDSGTTIIEASVSVRTLPTPTDTSPAPEPRASTDATLSSLSLSDIDLRLGDRLRPFSPDWTHYDARVAEDVTETTVSATVNHSGASYKVKLGGVVDDDGVIPLRMGSNVITIGVIAEDGVTTRIYTVRVTRSELPEPPPPALSTDATLRALTLSGIDIGTFDSATTSYRAQVANNRTETTVTATVNDDGANYKVKLNGMEDGDGVLPLAVGSNVIAIEVTAEDGSTSQTYTVIVTRDAPPPPVTDEETPPSATGELPTDDPPVNFRVTGYGHDWIYVAWEVPRDRGITNYVLQRYESDDSSSPDVLSEGPTNGGAGHGWGIGTVKPNTQYRYVLMLKSDSGTTIIEASVSVRTLPAPTDTSPAPEPRASTDATLSSLSLSDIDLRLGDRLRPFSPEWTHYDARVAEDVTETTVTVTVNNPEASYKVKLGGVVDADGVIPLRMGSSVITIAVTAEDGATTRIYTVRVTRSELPQTPPQTPHSLTKVSGGGQEGMASAQLAEPFVVSVLDQDSSPLAGVGVTFSVTAGGGLLSSTTATTDANGQAATRLTLGSNLGTNTVEATVEGLEPVTFTATAAEQAMPHSLMKVSGDDQEGTAGLLLDESFVVLVMNEDGAAMAGVVVSFSVTAGGGLLSSTTATTDANGQAATRLTLGSDLGTNAVEATVEGLKPVTFTAIGQEPPFASFFDLFDLLQSGKLVALPDHTQLLQNAPNPFNSQTVLSYFLLQPGLVRLEVFTLTGQRVAVLVQGQQQSGYHRLHWNGQDDASRPLASGIYLYRLVTSEGVLTRKLTLLQ